MGLHHQEEGGGGGGVSIMQHLLYWLMRSFRKGFNWSVGYAKSYGFYIHAGIDSGSDFVVYATVALNKEADSLMAGCSQAIALYGRTLKLRADMCFETAEL